MNHSSLVSAQLHAPMRSLALTVDETDPGEFRWRILESRDNPLVFEVVACADMGFAAYDTALATGYGELQRMVGPELQYGPRQETVRCLQRICVPVPSARRPFAAGAAPGLRSVPGVEAPAAQAIAC